MTAFTYGNGIGRKKTYDLDRRLTAITQTGVSGIQTLGSATTRTTRSRTLPIDQAKRKFGLDKDDVYDIKDGVGAGPTTWTGIAPNGDVWTGAPNGIATNHGPYGPYLPGGD